MKNFWKNYKSTIILLAAIIVGAILGICLKEKAAVLSPLGDIFLNLMFVVIVPLIFVTITTSIAKMKQPKRLGKVMVTIFVVFIITSLIAVLIGIASTYAFKLVEAEDGEQIKAALEEGTEVEEEEEVSILTRTVTVLTVKDFTDLFSKNNIIALLVFSILFGIAINMSGEKAKPVQDFLESLRDIIMNLLKIIMYYAPIGLGCYFAALVGTYGASIAVGYAKTFGIYTVVCILFYVIMYSLYAFIAAGRKGVKAFWANILPATITALATCSSAASIAVNAEGAKKIGVSEDIAETMIPLGTSFHKDGSIIGSVFKIMFLVCLFGTSVGVGKVLLVALLATLLITAVPIGGGTISEMMILTLMGFPVNALPILAIIATIIDAPATVLNVVGDTASSMLAARIVDGKDWMNKENA
ncbi:MAG: dicarboxylate/amino acid:cation symporter [Clostridia bacterium]|nr:dicarboxylate/amino acid:cation symporter [Bacilli bacterium]MBR3511572.1 dicarboxylate/amino acid:cation symporter [Clostridia bacterium]